MPHSAAVYVVDTTAEDDLDEDEGGDEGGNGSNGRQDIEMEDRQYIDDDGDGVESGPTHTRVGAAAHNPPPGGNEPSARIARVLVPDTQETSRSQAQSSEQPGNGSAADGASGSLWDGQSAPNDQSVDGSFVPETPRSANPQSPGTETRPEAATQASASGSTPSQDTQTGWSGGTLPARRGRSSRDASLPTTRRSVAPTSRSRPR